MLCIAKTHCIFKNTGKQTNQQQQTVYTEMKANKIARNRIQDAFRHSGTIANHL